MGEIKWSEKATNDLQAIFKYISKDSKFYAARFIKSLVDSTRILRTMPRCGRIVPELENYKFREIIFHNYRIVYRVLDEKDEIDILAVIHCARDFGNLFNEN